MQDVPPPQQRSSVGTGLILGGVTIGVIAVAALVYFMTRPRGEKVGESSLTDRDASVVVEAQQGDSLYFRTDVSIGIPVISLVDDDRLEREASDKLRDSQLTVRATSPSGVERRCTCRIYKGRATSTSTTTCSFSRSGMSNDCVLAIDAPGRWTVRASVAWAPDVALQSATLETRCERATH